MFQNKRILAIDDSPSVRGFLRRSLEAQGAVVFVAASGQEALDKCPDWQVDLVLLDLILPDMNGIQVLQHIRELCDDVAIVMLTGMGDIKTATEAVRYGADGYVVKRDLSTASDLSGFLYALEQAMAHRAGLVAQKQLQQVKADFYAMVTHDLRSPTGSILGAVDLLLDDPVAELAPDHAELVSLVREAAAKMLRLIDDYLDYARIEAGYLQLERTLADVRQAVEAAQPLAAAQASHNGQQLSFDLPAEPVWAHIDSQYLTQVCDNLISNALKYTPTGGAISVSLAEDGGCAVLQVADTGPGILPERLSALFTKYHRVPGQATRGIRGTGLGLLIAKEIVEAHDGHVEAHSEGVPGRGTTFIVRIPLTTCDDV